MCTYHNREFTSLFYINFDEWDYGQFEKGRNKIQTTLRLRRIWNLVMQATQRSSEAP
jgi:hypothetical protein